MTTQTTRSMIKLTQIDKSYGPRPVLHDISLEVNEGEVVAIIGPSGCGKSTLLRVISGLEEPDHGQVQLASEDITLVFQYSALFDSLTVYENVAFSLIEKPDTTRVSKTRRKAYTDEELHRIVSEKLGMLGLQGIEHLYPNQLSGGMQKRVSFARAIVSDPKIILYDEPTAGLDPIASTMIENYILKLQQQLKASSVVVTHQLTTIQRTANRICLLYNGSLQWQGTVQELFTTDNPYAKQFAHAALEGPMTGVNAG